MAPMKSSEETREKKRDRHVPGGFGTSAPYIPAAVRISIVRPFHGAKWGEERGARRAEYKRETHERKRKDSAVK